MKFLNNIIILPNNWCFGNYVISNQTFSKYIKRKITPAEIQKIMQKKAWFAPPALLAGGVALKIFFENGSSFVQQTQPRIYFLRYKRSLIKLYQKTFCGFIDVDCFA